jgi:hypothetical protein
MKNIFIVNTTLYSVKGREREKGKKIFHSMVIMKNVEER